MGNLDGLYGVACNPAESVAIDKGVAGILNGASAIGAPLAAICIADFAPICWGGAGIEGGAGAGAAGLEDIIKAEQAGSGLGGAGVVAQGAASVERTVQDIEAAGGTVLGREITLDVKEFGRVKISVRLPNGTDAFVEVKTGPGAALTKNQKAANPNIRLGGAIPVGSNAARAGLQVGQPLGPTPVYVVHQPWPLN